MVFFLFSGDDVNFLLYAAKRARTPINIFFFREHFFRLWTIYCSGGVRFIFKLLCRQLRLNDGGEYSSIAKRIQRGKEQFDPEYFAGIFFIRRIESIQLIDVNAMFFFYRIYLECN